jgi:hypothetical protein
MLDTKYVSGKEIDIESLPYLHLVCNQLVQNKGKNLHINYGQSQFTETGIIVGDKGERR